MSDRPEVTQKQIQSRATSQSFSRGKSLYRDNSISQTVRRGDEIEARCRGSYPEPYRVWVKFNGSEITVTGCNCEYDWGGDCKHIVALLLTYVNEPDRFEERQTLQTALMSRNKEDLVDIIMLMVTRYPDLQVIVDHPTPNEIATGMIPLDTLSFRQELRDAFTSYDDYYDYRGDPMIHKVDQVSSVADRLVERGDWLSASAVYRTILEEFADLDESYYHDEDGELGMSIDMAISALDRCLKQSIVIDSDNERHAIFDALLGVFIWDINFGGIGIGDEAPAIILKHVRREDIPEIRKLTEQARDQRLNRRHSDWAAEVYNGFLMDLDMLDEVDPEIILERLRAQEMYHLLVNKLLEMKRPDEAINVIKKEMNTAYEWTHALNLLVEHGHDTKAQQVAEEILANEYSYELTEWLLDRYKASDNKEGSLRWQKRQMQERPNIQVYGELKTTAQALNQWENLRLQIIRDLQASENYELLTRIYLHDEEWALAWETLPAAEQQYRSSIYPPKLDIIVAESSRHDLPERAIPVFVRYARQYIDSRGRDNYQQAASLLAKVQQAYDQLDEIETWETLIAGIRTEFKNLPALKDELKKAGL
ncbi:MAG: hypothetical protein H6673_12140 [Anaerolineales bacterium]|uniref:SWIM-type domain-containing protein n=1 Tax=Phototrophicus methaneseepsis TaxID=2710758 RepID=A0A7S8E9R6_9CHLR|nr:hypothetical protein [Phototrophicus methaneseepsis]MCB9437716.1 hypothetical protein [Anaerolineales bacterium]QPC83005.1 hypothetical protein G4Y79_01120 [Phototrophicus methaneseepsis]